MQDLELVPQNHTSVMLCPLPLPRNGNSVMMNLVSAPCGADFFEVGTCCRSDGKATECSVNQEEPWTLASRVSLRSTWWCQKVIVARVRVTFSRNEVRSMFTVGVVMQCIAIVSSHIRFHKIVEILV